MSNLLLTTWVRSYCSLQKQFILLPCLAKSEILMSLYNKQESNYRTLQKSTELYKKETKRNETAKNDSNTFGSYALDQ